MQLVSIVSPLAPHRRSTITYVRESKTGSDVPIEKAGGGGGWSESVRHVCKGNFSSIKKVCPFQLRQERSTLHSVEVGSWGGGRRGVYQKFHWEYTVCL